MRNRSLADTGIAIWMVALLLTASGVVESKAAVDERLLENRSVVVRAADAPAPTGPALLAKGGTGAASRSMTVALDAPEAAGSFAVVLEGVNPEDGWSLAIDGRPFEFDGYYTDDGDVWFRIAPGLFQPGANVLSAFLSSPAAPGLAAATDANRLGDIVVFSLDDPGEEEHFLRLAAGPSLAAQPPTDPSQDKMDVLHYVLDIQLNMNAASIPGAVLTMTARSLDSTLDTCVLDLDANSGNLVVSAVDSGPATPNLSFTHNAAESRLFIDLPAAVPEGQDFTVRVFYSGTPRANRGYRRATRNVGGTIPLIYTYSQPYRAREWWPCKDVPGDKFTMELIITCPDTVYNGYPLFPVSNGKLVSTTDNGDETRTFHWSEAYPVSTQNVSIACTNYRPAEAFYTSRDGLSTMSVCHMVYPESWDAESGEVVRTIEVMEHFADLFGEYPFLTEKYWTATWALSTGMEHQTCTSMPNGNLATPYHRRNVHELAHMWFGDAVGIGHFDHLWVSEGWGTYSEPLWVEHKSGRAAYHNYINAWGTSDTYPVVSTSADLFSWQIVYTKGAWILHMLRHAIGDEAFFQAARNYMLDPALRYGTALTDDLRAHFEATHGEDLEWYFDQWCYRASRPNYSWTWNTTTQGTDTIVHVGILQTQTDDMYIMPVDFRASLAGGGTAEFTVWNNERLQNFSANIGPGTVESLEFDPDRWILCVKSVATTGDPTAPPTLLSVKAGPGTNRMTLEWEPYLMLGLNGFRLYQSLDGATGWTLVQDEHVLDHESTSAVVAGLTPGDARYYRLTAVSNVEGPASAVYGARIPNAAQPSILIVENYERWLADYGTTHAFAAAHGRAVAAYPAAFDTASNKALGTTVALSDFAIVVWINGDESTVHQTFSPAEQAMVAAFLEAGGKLFVSGNEIGWDLGRSNRPQAYQDFYHNYLKAVFVEDDSGLYTVAGTGEDSVFHEDAYSYGGGDAPYTPGWPDEIAPHGGSLLALEYDEGVGAGIQYFGTFGDSEIEGAVVYLGFAFETLDSEAQRIQLMGRVLDAFFPEDPASSISGWQFY